jgi:hypothetical protein
MLRTTLFVLFAAGLFAQGDDPFNRPPADVDQALRARIQEFYQLHVKGDFRHAEALVAEDTREFYYSHNKPQYLSAEISRIAYSDNFTKAKATILCEQYIMMPGFSDKPVKVPTPSTWKIVDGKWYWYVDPESLRDSPFGKMTSGAGPAKGGAPALPTIPANADFLFAQVQLDKKSVTLKFGESETVTIANGAPGMMNISLGGMLPGVEGKLDHTSLKAGEKATLTLRAGQNAKPGTIKVVVEQTGQLLPIQVGVDANSLPKPSGNLTAGQGPAQSAAPALPPIPSNAGLPGTPVQLDKKSVTLTAGKSETVTIANGAPGVMNISVSAMLPGIEGKLDHNSMKAGEKATLTLRARHNAKPGIINVVVKQTGQFLPIQVNVK